MSLIHHLLVIFRYSTFVNQTTTGTRGDLDFSSNSCHVLSVMFLFMIFTALFGGMEITFVGLLVTYSYSYLDWEKTTALYMIALYQITKAIFSLLLSFPSKYIQDRVIIAFDMILLVGATVCESFWYIIIRNVDFCSFLW